MYSNIALPGPGPTPQPHVSESLSYLSYKCVNKKILLNKTVPLPYLCNGIAFFYAISLLSIHIHELSIH